MKYFIKYFERSFGILMAAGGVFFIREGIRLGYITYRVPGAGFFPVWAGILLMVAGLLMAIRRPVSIRDAEEIEWSKQFSAILMVAVYVLLIQYIGTLLGTAFYFILTLWVIGRHALRTVLLCGGISIAIIYLVFEVWLKIPLSLGIFETF